MNIQIKEMSPRTSLQFEKIREEKSALIREAALELFAGDGYHATTISHIARRAGISKGLMYNYFGGKEELLSAIIRESVREIYTHFDVDRDGYLSQEEFEFFVRKVAQVLREKKEFWQLFFQLMLQREVRSRLFEFLQITVAPGTERPVNPSEAFMPNIFNTISEYFLRKKEVKGSDYDPDLDMNLFMMTMKGFAVTYIYSDKDDTDNFNKCVDAMVQNYR
jgi:AcrR family transcriptional regulator